MQDGERLVDSKPRFKRVLKILTKAFPDSIVHIEDESRRHAKHMLKIEKKGVAEGAEETHFVVEIISSKFKNVSRIERQRIVHDLLKKEFEAGLHSLKLSVRES